jgi:translation initiation factor 2 subunit 2
MSAEDKHNQAEEEEEEADVAAMLDLSTKKKKKKKKKTKEAGDDATVATVGEGAADMSEQQRMLQEDDDNQEMNVDGVEDRKADYSYGELLERVVDLLHTNNPDLVDKKRTRIKPPALQLMGSKKTLWVNFQEICSMMQRDPQHIFSFFMAELGTEGSMDGNQRLIIRGRFVAKYIESLLRKYVVEYVTCEMCRSPNTDLDKNQASRLYFCTCRDCGSSRSVAPIRSGYHATSRADRRAARNAKG